MNTPDTHEGLDEAYNFAKQHGKIVALCDTLEKHIEKIRSNTVSDSMNIINSELDVCILLSKAIRTSDNMTECYDLHNKIFQIHDFIEHFDQMYHFGAGSRTLMFDLETILMNMYEIVEPYCIHKDLKPE